MTAPYNHPLVRALRAFNSELAANNRCMAARVGLNDSDLAVLDILHREGPQSPSALAQRTRIATTTMTGILRRLSAGGWVERRTSDKDLRSFTIHISAVARLSGVFRPVDERLINLVDELPEQDAQRIVTFLGDATRIVRESHASGDSHP